MEYGWRELIPLLSVLDGSVGSVESAIIESFILSVNNPADTTATVEGELHEALHALIFHVAFPTNAAVMSPSCLQPLIKSLCQHFSSVLVKLLQYDGSGSLLLVSELDLERVVQMKSLKEVGLQPLSIEENRGPHKVATKGKPTFSAHVYEEMWMKSQRKRLRSIIKHVAFSSMELTALKYLESPLGMEYLNDLQNESVKAVAPKMQIHTTELSDASDSWFVRILRFLLMMMLDADDQRRQPAVGILRSIFLGLQSTFTKSTVKIPQYLAQDVMSLGLVVLALDDVIILQDILSSDELKDFTKTSKLPSLQTSPMPTVPRLVQYPVKEEAAKLVVQGILAACNGAISISSLSKSIQQLLILCHASAPSTNSHICLGGMLGFWNLLQVESQKLQDHVRRELFEQVFDAVISPLCSHCAVSMSAPIESRQHRAVYILALEYFDICFHNDRLWLRASTSNEYSNEGSTFLGHVAMKFGTLVQYFLLSCDNSLAHSSAAGIEGQVEDGTEEDVDVEELLCLLFHISKVLYASCDSLGREYSSLEPTVWNTWSYFWLYGIPRLWRVPTRLWTNTSIQLLGSLTTFLLSSTHRISCSPNAKGNISLRNIEIWNSVMQELSTMVVNLSIVQYCVVQPDSASTSISVVHWARMQRHLVELIQRLDSILSLKSELVSSLMEFILHQIKSSLSTTVNKNNSWHNVYNTINRFIVPHECRHPLFFLCLPSVQQLLEPSSWQVVVDEFFAQLSKFRHAPDPTMLENSQYRIGHENLSNAGVIAKKRPKFVLSGMSSQRFKSVAPGTGASASASRSSMILVLAVALLQKMCDNESDIARKYLLQVRELLQSVDESENNMIAQECVRISQCLDAFNVSPTKHHNFASTAMSIIFDSATSVKSLIVKKKTSFVMHLQTWQKHQAVIHVMNMWKSHMASTTVHEDDVRYFLSLLGHVQFHFHDAQLCRVLGLELQVCLIDIFFVCRMLFYCYVELITSWVFKIMIEDNKDIGHRTAQSIWSFLVPASGACRQWNRVLVTLGEALPPEKYWLSGLSSYSTVSRLIGSFINSLTTNGTTHDAFVTVTKEDFSQLLASIFNTISDMSSSSKEYRKELATALYLVGVVFHELLFVELSSAHRRQVTAQLASLIVLELASMIASAMSIEHSLGDSKQKWAGSVYDRWLAVSIQGLADHDSHVRQEALRIFQTLVPLSALGFQSHTVSEDQPTHSRPAESELHSINQASNMSNGAFTTIDPGNDKVNDRIGEQCNPFVSPTMSLRQLFAKTHSLSFLSSTHSWDQQLIQRLLPYLRNAAMVQEREYQWEAVLWWTTLRRCGLGGILADEMYDVNSFTDFCSHGKCLVSFLFFVCIRLN